MKTVTKRGNFSVKIRANEFVKRRLVYGPIWLEFDDLALPIKGWTDFPVIILGWWLNNLKPLINSQSIKCECLFMDGSYMFEVVVKQHIQPVWVITFIEDCIDKKGRLATIEASPKCVIDEILSSANVVADYCKQRGWKSDDLTILENEIKEVEELVRSTSLETF
jgi:hypothetical protein